MNLFPGYMNRYRQSQSEKAVTEYCKLAEKYSLTPTELALGWCYKQPHVASTIIGATSMAQLKENIGAYSKIDQITDEVVAGIEGIFKVYRDPSNL